MIYFIRDPSANLVKIGYSANPWRRVEALQVASAAQLLTEAVIDGDVRRESDLHARFAAQRVRGEWFRWSGPIAAYCTSLDSIAAPAGKRDPLKTTINRAITSLGFSTSYCAELHSGRRRWTIAIALGVWRETGHLVGPLVDATVDELKVLEKYVGAAQAAERRAA